MVDTDVLVVGGGPGGVISALTAARSDKKVILCDLKSYDEIGNKTCGDALQLTPLTFLEEKLGIKKPYGDEIADNVERLVFKTPRADFPVEGEGYVGYVLNRHPYGQRLLKTAETDGVEVRPETRVLKAIITNGFVSGAEIQDKKTKEKYNIHAKITVDCSGRNFRVRKTIPNDLFPYLEKTMEKRDIAATYREIITLKGNDHPYRNEIYMLYHDEIPEPGYFWIFSKGKNRLNVGIGWFMDIKIEKGMKDLFRVVLHKYYPEGTYEVEDKGGGQIPARYPLTNAVAPGFLAVGDAAFHVNPLTCEGHGPALTAGYYAGKTAVEAIEANDLSEKQLWRYNVDVMGHFGLSHTKVQLFTEALRTIKVKGVEFLLKRKILDRDQFVDLHAGKGLGFLGFLKIAIKAFPRYSILWNINKIRIGAQTFEKLFAEYPDSPEEYPAWLSSFNSEMSQIKK
ncbi:MAG: NAD(P)/FAD-dependent oxidoreductase [Candidatus Hodarchaeales archaeon]